MPVTRHNAVTNRVRGGFQAVCLEGDCDWKGPVREASNIVLERIARQKARDLADEDSEHHADNAELQYRLAHQGN